jgi:hypothetical protein
MVSKKLWSFLLTVIIGLAAALISPGILGIMTPALAQEPELEINVPVAQPVGNLIAVVVFTDPAIIDIQDLQGVGIGQGTHVGRLRCNNKCSQKTQLQLNGVTYEYQFKTRQLVDPGERRIIAAGTGTIKSNGQRERFLFTATFQDNRDGTVWVRYETSGPDASFIIPNAPGTFTIFSRR